MEKNIIVTIPNLSAPGGVNFFWDALLPHLSKYDSLNLNTMEVGGYGKNILAPFADQWKFNRKVNAKIDLVILNPSLGYKSFFRDALFAKQLNRKKKPFVVFFHGWDLDFEKKVTEKYTRFFRNSFGKAEKIIVLSNDFKETLRQWGYEGEVIIETTAVDSALLTDFTFEDNRALEKKIKILFLSRLLKEKGIYETIEAFRKIKHDYDVELIIAGDGEAYDALKNFTENDDDIIMTGRVVGSEKIKLFENSGIYCLPSYTEGLPTSVLEAIAFGIPVITSRVGGLKDFFEDGKMGYFVEHKNPLQIKEKLRSLLSDREVMQKMSRFNYNYAKQHLTGAKVAKRVHGHLASLLS